MIKFNATVFDTALAREVQTTCFASSMRDALAWFTVKYAVEPTNLYAAEANIDAANTPLVAFTVAVDGGVGCLVYPMSGNVITGSRVVLAPVPAPGYHLVGYFIDGAEVTPVDVDTLVIDESCVITAQFAAD